MIDIPLDEILSGGKIVSTKAISTVCNTSIISAYILVFGFVLFAILLLFYRYSDTVKLKFYRFFAVKGYIRIYLISENRTIKPKLVKLDKYNNFKIKSRKYTLEKLYDFILGYDKYGFPVFLYDYQFILPLYITKERLTKEIKLQLKDYIHNKLVDSKGNVNLKKQDELISAITMKLDSNVLDTVYKKKLISDLYSISGDVDFKKKAVLLVIIIIGIIFLYYTGLLSQLLAYVGVDLPAP